MKDLIITEAYTLKEAMKKLDLGAMKILFVIDENKKLIGSLTDGDIRRYILKGGDLDKSISGIFNSETFCLVENEYTELELKEFFTQKYIEVIPVIDINREIVKYETWNQVFSSSKKKPNRGTKLKNIPVVIMAGGKGTRLKPFTDVLPKPLVPIQERPIMDWIIDEFYNYGARQYYATLNYRGKMIEAYYSSIDKKYNIGFKWEKDFYGTAGSLKLLTEEITGTFIVSNCDIIVKANYDDVMDFHKKSGAMMTVVSSIQHHQIPYGVIEFSDGGVITQIKEKPEYTHVINTGVYILEKECLDFIPKDEFFHITHLIETLMDKGLKIVTYPVSEKEYVDIGQWKEYMSAVDNFKF